jgi:hypothetical protein
MLSRSRSQGAPDHTGTETHCGTRGHGAHGVDTLPIVITAVSLRQVTMTLAFVGIIAKVGLFVWVNHTSDWTVGTSTLAGLTLVLGLLTMVLAVADLVRSQGHWLPLVAFMLGLLTFAPVIGYAT